MAQVVGQIDIACPWCDTLVQVLLCGGPDKNAWPKANHEEISDKCKLKNILQNNILQAVLFANVKDIQDKESLRNYSKLKETRDIWQLNATHHLGLESRPMKDIIGTDGKIWMLFVD